MSIRSISLFSQPIHRAYRSVEPGKGIQQVGRSQINEVPPPPRPIETSLENGETIDYWNYWNGHDNEVWAEYGYADIAD